MCWFCLIMSVVGLVSGIYARRWHEELDKLLDTNPYQVEYLDYLLSSFGIIAIIFSIPSIIASVYLCIINYF